MEMKKAHIWSDVLEGHFGILHTCARNTGNTAEKNTRFWGKITYFKGVSNTDFCRTANIVANSVPITFNLHSNSEINTVNRDKIIQIFLVLESNNVICLLVKLHSYDFEHNPSTTWLLQALCICWCVCSLHWSCVSNVKLMSNVSTDDVFVLMLPCRPFKMHHWSHSGRTQTHFETWPHIYSYAHSHVQISVKCIQCYKVATHPRKK